MSYIGAELRRLRKEVVRLNRKLAMQRMSGKVVARDPQARKVRVELGEDPATGEKVLSPWLRVQGLSAGKFKVFVLPSVGEQVYVESPSGVVGADSLVTFGAFDGDHPHPAQEADELVIEKGDKRIVLSDAGIRMVAGDHAVTLNKDGLDVDAKTAFRKGFTQSGPGRAQTIEGDVRVKGNIFVTKDVRAEGEILPHSAIPAS